MAKVSVEIFEVTQKFKTAVILINDLEAAKFPLLLSRILQKLDVKNERIFSEEEEVKLQTSLSLNAQELKIVLEVITYILQRSAYYMVTPGTLKQQLERVELNQTKVEAIVHAWINEAKGLVTKLRQKTVGNKQLDSVHWHLNLLTAQANKTKLKQPIAQFDLGIADSSTNGTEQIHLEFSHDELYKFYRQLEDIQSQLDSLR